MLDTWERIDEANRAAGWYVPLTLAERDQIEAWADELNRELFGHLRRSSGPNVCHGSSVRGWAICFPHVRHESD